MADPSSVPPATTARAVAPPPVSAAFLLIALGRRVGGSVEDRLREHGIGFAHLSVLGHLAHRPGLSYSELARRARVRVQSMQTTVAHLEEQGLVARGATRRGRRADLSVTSRGTQVLAAARASVRAVDEELLDGFTASERASLEAALSRLFAADRP